MENFRVGGMETRVTGMLGEHGSSMLPFHIPCPLRFFQLALPELIVGWMENPHIGGKVKDNQNCL